MPRRPPFRMQCELCIIYSELCCSDPSVGPLFRLQWETTIGYSRVSSIWNRNPFVRVPESPHLEWTVCASSHNSGPHFRREWQCPVGYFIVSFSANCGGKFWGSSGLFSQGEKLLPLLQHVWASCSIIPRLNVMDAMRGNSPTSAANQSKYSSCRSSIMPLQCPTMHPAGAMLTLFLSIQQFKCFGWDFWTSDSNYTCQFHLNRAFWSGLSCLLSQFLFCNCSSTVYLWRNSSVRSFNKVFLITLIGCYIKVAVVTLCVCVFALSESESVYFRQRVWKSVRWTEELWRIIRSHGYAFTMQQFRCHVSRVTGVGQRARDITVGFGSPLNLCLVLLSALFYFRFTSSDCVTVTDPVPARAAGDWIIRFAAGLDRKTSAINSFVSSRV